MDLVSTSIQLCTYLLSAAVIDSKKTTEPSDIFSVISRLSMTMIVLFSKTLRSLSPSFNQSVGGKPKGEKDCT